MSFEKRKKLADLKADCDVIFQHRLEVLQEKKKQVISSMRDEAVYFLVEQGFSVDKLSLVRTPLSVEADYKGSMKIRLVFSDPKDSFMGADITLDVDYLRQKFEFSINLARQSFPHIWEDDLDVAISLYTELHQKLIELDSQDISGNYDITLIKDSPQTFNCVSDMLKFVLEM